MERLQSGGCDLLITDLKMPGMSGLEVLQAVRVLQPEMPVILITGYAAVDNAVEVMKNGAADYLAKPFANEEIVAKVRKALEARAVLLDEIYLRRELHEVCTVSTICSARAARCRRSISEFSRLPPPTARC